MRTLQIDEFTTTYLQGAFNKWEPNSYMWSFWRDKLQQIDFEVAKTALNLYVEDKTKTEDEPTWQRFKNYLKQVSVKSGEDRSYGSETVLLAQCYCHRIPALIGQVATMMYTGTGEQAAANDYQVQLVRGKGGLWQVVIAYGFGSEGHRQARRDMRIRRTAAGNYFATLGFNKDWWLWRKPLEREYFLEEVASCENVEAVINSATAQAERHRLKSKEQGGTVGRVVQDIAAGGDYGSIEDMPF